MFGEIISRLDGHGPISNPSSLEGWFITGWLGRIKIGCSVDFLVYTLKNSFVCSLPKFVSVFYFYFIIKIYSLKKSYFILI